MPHPYDILKLPDGASMIFTPCPGTRETSVAEAVSTLKAAGANVLISLMPAEELDRFAASALPDICAAQGITWLHLPVEDDHSPDERFAAAFAQHKTALLGLLEQGGRVAIHCRGGSGRTGFMAAILLLESHHDWGEVARMVQGLRPGALKLPVHLDYLRETYRVMI